MPATVSRDQAAVGPREPEEEQGESAGPRNSQLANVPRSSQDLAVQSPVEQHQQQILHFDTIVSFGRRAKHFYGALADISTYLPNEGKTAIEAMRLVTTQRKWMYDVGCAVGTVVGTFYQLEKNTLSELEVMWKTGQCDMTMKSLKKNFRATMKNLNMLADYRRDADATIQECEKYANQMVRWHGHEEKMQHAVMEVVAQFGGSAQCQALIEDLQRCNAVLAKAQELESRAAGELSQLRGAKENLQLEALVYDSIAANEKGSLDKLQRRAQEMDTAAAEKAEAAASTFNIAHKRRHWLWGTWKTDWVDNTGDVAAWRAERFKQISQGARGSEEDQQARVKRATAEAAKLKGRLVEAAGNVEQAEKEWSRAVEGAAKAREELRQTKGRAAELRHQFGNIDLHHIASLRDHMQKFPELLGAQGMEDTGMFASMKGALKQHQRLCDRMQIFLEEEDDHECKTLLNSLKPQISQAIRDSHFFSATMAPLRDEVDRSLRAVKDSPPPAIGCAPAVPQSLPASSAGGEDSVAVSLKDDDEDELW